VSLIVIVLITAVKDAVEDYRRTILDIELNNSSVHRLVDWNNVNASEDNISLWRRFKKAMTRTIVAIWGKIKRNKIVPGKQYVERALDEPRESYDTGVTRRASAFSMHSQRISFTSARGEIQMAPVPSPLTLEDARQVPDRPNTEFSYETAEHAPLEKNFGNLINPNLPVTGKPRFHRDYWKNVKVGDFVRIYNDDQIPADVVILSTSDTDGACYVETKNLDGETNLKVRHALRSGRKIKHARDCERTEFTIESEAPQANLYQYSAVARWIQHNPKNPDSPGREWLSPYPSIICFSEAVI
jgi:phospholipid-translocating ATPase